MTGSRSGSLKNLVVGVAVLLPAAVLSLFLVVVAAGLLGPTWGSVAIAAWLVVGVLVWTRAGERVIARLLLRYRPAPGSWLAAEVTALMPGRRVRVYVAPGTCGVFPVGAFTIAIGARSVANGAHTPALQAAAAAAAADLQRRRTRAQLPMLWWAGPWLFATMVLAAVLGRRLTAAVRVIGVVCVSLSIAISLGHGQPVAAVLGVLVLADVALSAAARGRQRAARRGPMPTLASA